MGGGALGYYYTPEHTSWLNMVEIEIGVLRSQCLDRRIGEREQLVTEITAWEQRRNASGARINWMFTTDRAREKLARAYPNVNPRLQAAMDDRLARAVPTAAGDLRYEPWGRAVGRSPSARISPLQQPDTRLSRCEYLLQQAPGLPSRNLGTLLDHLKAAGLI